MWNEVIHNVYWAIGDGRLINFWEDDWLCRVGPLSKVVGPNHHNSHLRLCDLTTVDGT